LIDVTQHAQSLKASVGLEGDKGCLHGFEAYQSREGQGGAMMKCAGATKRPSEKSNGPVPGPLLSDGFKRLHSLRESSFILAVHP